MLKQVNEATSASPLKSESIAILASKKRWATVKMMPSIYPGIISEAGLRWAIFNERQNGFDKCIRRLGRKVLIDLDAFEVWIDTSK